MPNAVLDSTILVSAFLRPEGVAAVLLRHATGGVFPVSLSPALIAETESVLRVRPHIRRRYHYTDEEVSEFAQSLRPSRWSLTSLIGLALSVIQMMTWSLPRP